MEHFAKILMPEFRHGTRKFLVQGKFCGTMSLWLTFHKKNKKKKDPTGKHFGVFSPRYIKTAFWMKNLTQRWTQSGPFPRIIPLFLIFKKRAGEATSILPLTLIACLRVQLNMHQFLWISLNIFENAWKNSPDYATAMRMPDHLTCSTGFWRCLGF